MAGARISCTFETGKLTEALGRVRAAAANPAPLLELIGDTLVEAVRDRFEAAQAPDGTPWVALNPEYAKTKQGPGILRERAMSGGLMGSITSEVDGASVLVGTNKVYGAIHQFGGKIKPKNAAALVYRLGDRLIRAKSVTMPARPYLGLSPADESLVVENAETYLAEVLVAEG